jgi:hypothetical protein
METRWKTFNNNCHLICISEIARTTTEVDRGDSDFLYCSKSPSSMGETPSVHHGPEEEHSKCGKLFTSFHIS